MNLCSIASGSSGNCIYVGSNNTHLLIDAGISGKKVESGLLEIGINPKDLNGILITHEHSDHISGVGVLARRYGTPIYATAETVSSFLRYQSVGRIPDGLIHIIEPDFSFNIDEILVEPFSISHDASNPVCYTLQFEDKKIGFATDLGKFDDYIVSKLSNSDILFLEANHDIRMLEVGPYPYYLKQRILGDRGHLSNENSGKLICKLLHNKLKHVILGHLSKENNYESLAYETVLLEIEEGSSYGLKDFSLKVAKREMPSELIVI